MAIIWTPVFPISLGQVTQLFTTDFVTQLISFNVMPLPQYAPLRWHHSAINSITFDFFDRIIRCIHSSCNPHLLMHPLTFSMHLTSINGARKHSALAILRLLSFYFSLTSSSLKCFAWKKLIMLSLASYGNSTSNSIPVDFI